MWRILRCIYNREKEEKSKDQKYNIQKSYVKIIYSPSSVILKKLSFDGMVSDVVLDAELTAAYKMHPNSKSTHIRTPIVYKINVQKQKGEREINK